MSRLLIRHETTYRYDRPVGFGPWRLIMRPLDTHALRVVEARLTLTPPGVTRWSTDAAGNSVCTFEPQGESDVLSVVSELTIETYPAAIEPPLRDDPRSIFPILYDPGDRAVLEPYLRPATEDADEAYVSWVRGVAQGADRLAVDVLREINTRIHAEFSYGARFEPGVQTPAQTVSMGSGTCRDFAWLMVETCRRLGFAARFITGYLYSPAADPNVRGAGATHAWCEVFLPALGWLEFDPTNGLAESHDLVRVAATRTPEEASPMSGFIIGDATAQMFVDVRVEDAFAPDAPAVSVAANL